MLNYYPHCRKLVLFLFCFLSFGGLVSGALLCLIKSPQTQTQSYMLLADRYMDKAIIANNDEAEYLFKASTDMVLMAVHYTPYNDEVWQKLSLITKNHQDLLESKPAKNLAFSSF